MIVDKIPEGFDRISIALAGEDTIRFRIQLCENQEVVVRDRTLEAGYHLGKVRGFGTERKGYIFQAEGFTHPMKYSTLEELFVRTSEDKPAGEGAR